MILDAVVHHHPGQPPPPPQQTQRVSHFPKQSKEAMSRQTAQKPTPWKKLVVIPNVIPIPVPIPFPNRTGRYKTAKPESVRSTTKLVSREKTLASPRNKE
ncbi:hypothetical protein LZ32DRAFT_126902 [Colletotrichum eremochloae]|nr:hypothetical protein LZ32DRAFT_126902 [Colletotrichum eremochloae]